jgi:hypothetical protein
MEIDMNNSFRLFTALLLGLSVTGLASISLAQDNAARDAAIAKCIKQAQTQYPGDDVDTQRGRTSVYKACMTTAGFQP